LSKKQVGEPLDPGASRSPGKKQPKDRNKKKKQKIDFKA